MSATRFRVVLEYDGTDFHGWQAQPGVRTVEGCLREAVAPLSPDGFETTGASRTDTGVHARGQCALVTLTREREPLELRKALAARTPPDMGVVSVDAVGGEFHPRTSAIEKRYLYVLNDRERPTVLGRGFHWWVPRRLDVDAMAEGSRAWIGRHDFAAFRNRSKDEPPDTVKTVHQVDVSREGEWVFVQVIGDGFLYRMVRNFVGTLVEVGRGHWAPAECGEILASTDRGRAGPSAPPQGLSLMEIAYPDTPRCVPQSPTELLLKSGVG